MMLSRKMLRSAVAAGVGAGAFAVGALGAPLVLGQSSDEPVMDDPGGPATSPVTVTSGQSRYFGRWQIVTSKTSSGTPCVGVRLLDAEAVGGPSVAGGCGASTSNQVGSIIASAGQQGTLFFGRVDSRTATAEVTEGGRQKLKVKALTGSDGRTYIAADSLERIRGAEVRLADRQGNDLGRVDPAAK